MNKKMSPPQLSSNFTRQTRNVIEITNAQWDSLEAFFAKVKNPHPTDLVLLAAEIGLDETEVKAWYNQRLATWRREQGLSTATARV